MDIQQKNQMKQHKENLEKQYEQQQRLAPVRVQDKFNKENLEIQHKYNLEIFEKQAELTREMQEKQRTLTITLIIVTAFSTVAASVIGALLITYLGSKEPNIKTQANKQGLEQILKQNNQTPSVSKMVLGDPPTKTKPSEQRGSSSKGSLKTP